MRAAAAVLLAAALGACSSPTGRRTYEGPALPPLAVTFTTDPPALADGLARDAAFVIGLDDLPDPETASFGPILLRSGRGTFDLDLHVDLVARAITVRSRGLLAPETAYEVQVDTRVGALSGRTVGMPVAATFTTGNTLAGHTPPPSPSWRTEVQPLLVACQAGCHTRDNPQRRLDLTGDPADATYGLVAVPSLGLQGTAGQLPRVQPADSSRSVLIRKLLGGNRAEQSSDPPYPNTRVDGVRMPPGGPYLDDATIALIARWIDAGAPID